ncbi:MAG: hypothetical protein LZF62_300047 [Nitrospira sp.]|nr:MAG: hypothetical protein LZF62_300047 [Nitrospira sp.]
MRKLCSMNGTLRPTSETPSRGTAAEWRLELVAWGRAWKLGCRGLHHGDSLLTGIQLDSDPLTD